MAYHHGTYSTSIQGMQLVIAVQNPVHAAPQFRFFIGYQMRPWEGCRIEIETQVERNTYSHALMQPCSRFGTITLNRNGYLESRD